MCAHHWIVANRGSADAACVLKTDTGSAAAGAGPRAGPIPAALGFVLPIRNCVVAISGDFDQFLIEELAVGAQFGTFRISVTVNNALMLDAIRQSQRAFDMDYCVQLAFENINSSEVNGYGVDSLKSGGRVRL